MHTIRKLLATFVFAFIATSGSAQTNGLNFDGSNDQVLIPNLVSVGSFTIEYWVKTTATAPTGYQWYYGPGIVDAEVGGVTNDFGTALVGDKLAFGIGNPDVTIFSTTSINDGAWHHVAASWDVSSGAMKLYIDGALEASGSGGTGNRTAPPNIAFGKMQTSVYYFNGSIDEVRIWNRVLCQSEITNNISCELTGTQDALKGYYQCNQGTAGGTNTGITTLTDASGNSNNGTMSNFALTGSTSNFVTGAVSGTCSAYPGVQVTGTSAICSGNTTTLSSTNPGGSWSSSNTAVGTINYLTGAFTGLSAGTSTVSYFSTCGIASGVVTVNAAPAISLPANQTICNGNVQPALSFGTGTGYYTWTISSSVGTVASTGTVCGMQYTEGDDLVISAPTGAVFTDVQFASYGTPNGSCGSFTTGSCHASTSDSVVRSLLIGNSTATINAGNATFGDPCFGTGKRLYITAVYSYTTIPSFTAVNTGSTPIVATVNVTAVNGSCTSAPQSFTITVNNTPADITGIPALCQYSSTTFSNTTTGGTWSSSNTVVGTIDTSGHFLGIGTGTSSVSYMLPNGCFDTITARVSFNSTSTFIVTPNPVCAGATATFTNDGITCGKNAISFNGSSGVALKTGPISTAIYGITIEAWIKVTSNGGIQTIVLNGANGSSGYQFFIGSSGYLGLDHGGIGTNYSSYYITPGVWTYVAATISSTGAVSLYKDGVGQYVGNTVTEVPAGYFAIGGNQSGSQTFNGTIDEVSFWTVERTASEISSDMSSCSLATQDNLVGNWRLNEPSGTIALDASGNGNTLTISGGTRVVSGVHPNTYSWNFGDATTATTNPTSKVYSTAGSYTAMLTVTATNGCSSTGVGYVTVTPLPSPISGSATLCLGSSSTFTDTVSGGTWSSSATAIATVNSSGLVTAIAGGTAIISYTTTCGTVTQTVTVTPLPSAGTISGTTTTYIGGTVALSASMGGGSWISSAPSIATVGASGVVSGLGVGTATIYYVVSNTCGSDTANVNVTITATSVIGGTNVICQGDTTTLTNAVSGGLWSSSSSAVATVNAYSGLVTGTGGGTCTISYTTTSGYTTSVITVNPSPATITGLTYLCQNAASTYSSTDAGGMWTSSNAAIGTIDAATGIAGGVAASGSVTFTYTLPTGCATTKSVIVTPLPAAITGPSNVCTDYTVTLTSTSGGTWNSSNTAVATISAAGVVTGVHAGTTIVSYTSPFGCLVKTVLTVNTTPDSITGTNMLCTGNTTTLDITSSGGAWSSSNTAVATVDGSGEVSALTSGTSAISYTTTAGCYSAYVVTVNSTPFPITGGSGICQGGSIVVHNATAGGTWTVDAGGYLTVGSSGIVTGIATGIGTVSYVMTSGCAATKDITVYASPSAITGPTALCTGDTVAYSSATPGGTWSINSTSSATIDASGNVVGVAYGVPRISYILSSGCGTTKLITINSAPSAVSGTTTICEGTSTTLSCSPAGGTWNIGSTAVATIDTAGLVTAVASGSTPVTYTAATGCSRVASVTVNAVPAAIAGSPNLCVGSTTSLTTSPAGGTWTSASTGVATIVDGIVTGITAGTSRISYVLSGGCGVSKVVTVDAAVSTISGAASVCLGSSTTFSTASSGGVWSSSDAAIASVNSSGVITGVAVGTANITYATSAYCYAVKSISVFNAPTSITGTASICKGTTTTLSSTPAGGVWLSDNVGVASVTPAGLVTSFSAGVANITYTLPAGCSTTTAVTVNALPDTLSTSFICLGGSTTFSSTPSGGTWSSSNSAVATINIGTGLANGLSNGTTVISYVTSAGCSTARTITVNASVPNPTPNMNVCLGATVTMNPVVAGGTWTSSNTAKATIGITNGVLTGLATGTTVIYYSLGGGCGYTTNVTITNVPASLYGSNVICSGKSAGWISTASGGAWHSANTGIANVNMVNGVVTGISSGVTTISYTIVGCVSTRSVTINASPAAITGPATVAIGNSITLADATPAGAWTSSNIAKATVATGTVTGVATGAATITYTLASNGCFATKSITVTATRPDGSVDANGSGVATIRIFPNPTKGILNIESPVAGQFAVFTLDGREIAKYDITQTVSGISLPANLAAGVYITYFVGTDGSETTVRIVYEQ